MHSSHLSQPLFLTLIALLIVACSTSEPTAVPTPTASVPTTTARPTAKEKLPTAPEEQAVPPVYVTIAGHIEDTPVYANCEAYPDFRRKLLVFAETLSQTGAAFNLQIDYEFLLGASRCETDEMQATTDGLNAIDYLATHYGFEIDAHQEGGWEEGADNYADVRFLAGTLTPAASENVGGLVWDSPGQFARLAQGEPGRIYPDFTWAPQVLTLAVSHDHHLGDFSRDDVACGIWIPKGANENFWVHDPSGPMVYVGPGEHANWDPHEVYLSTPDFVRALSDLLEQGAIPRDRMYTASLAVPQSVIFHSERHPELLTLLDQLAPLVESGRAEYVTYSQAVETWRAEYDARPNVYYREAIHPPTDGE